MAGLATAAVLLGAAAGCDRFGQATTVHAGEALPANAPAAAPPACAPGNGGLKLPAGFCAPIFVDSAGSPR
ncbi:MAG: glucose dehydrogenase, partial [Candidatus Eremiobacteraeota bacterium]|nr:glucose dehydrogenase [Candidatus Eremiobacteraeota bacterium]